MRKFLLTLVVLGLASTSADARPHLFPRLHARLSGSGREPCGSCSTSAPAPVQQAPPVFSGPVANGVRMVVGETAGVIQRVGGCSNGRCPQ